MPKPTHTRKASVRPRRAAVSEPASCETLLAPASLADFSGKILATRNQYSIGLQAAKIISVHVDMSGNLYLNVRSGIPLSITEDYEQGVNVGSGETITVEVTAGFGSLTISPVIWTIEYDEVSLALGGGSFDATEIRAPYSGNGGGSAGKSTKLVLKATTGKLNWAYGGLAGEVLIDDDHYPEVAVMLRLPSGSKGSVSFANSTFGGKASFS